MPLLWASAENKAFTAQHAPVHLAVLDLGSSTRKSVGVQVSGFTRPLHSRSCIVDTAQRTHQAKLDGTRCFPFAVKQRLAN
jgi:hypothetical protein